jgi:myo-inositol 2-dehydrogenase/D-chiro-inositol 1-dehydrogenase
MTMDGVRVGLIGAGRIGSLHARHLAHRLPDAELLAVADVFREAAEQCAAECKVPSAYQDYRYILDDPDIQAVVICTSTDTHAAIIEDAAARGKHIFCEKPLDLDLARTDRVLAAVEDAGVKLQVGFNRRFDPGFQRARELVASGRIGTPHIVRITSRDPEPPPISYVKVSGGIFLDMTIHDFDMARFLIDAEVAELYATGGVMVDARIGEAGDIDTATICLRYANGAMGTIDNSRQAVYGYDQRVEVFGSGGMVSVGNERRDAVEWSVEDGVHTSLPLYFFIERYTEAYLAEMQAFVECIRRDEAPPVTGLDGRAAVLMGYAARRSLETNRPVRLSEVDSASEAGP